MLRFELDAFKAAIAKAPDFANPEAYIAEQEAKFKEALAEHHSMLEERVAALETRFDNFDQPAVMPAPPQHDAFIDVGATRFSDGQVQTEESLAAASAAWGVANHETII